MARLSYSFGPLRLVEADLARIHGANERISIDGYAGATRFYRQWLTNAAR